VPGVKDLAPHDLRRTCARLCHLAGGELEQIQFLLGHASVQTTERYLGCKQRISQAVNDNLGLEDTWRGWSRPTSRLLARKDFPLVRNPWTSTQQRRLVEITDTKDRSANQRV